VGTSFQGDLDEVDSSRFFLFDGGGGRSAAVILSTRSAGFLFVIHFKHSFWH